MTFLQPDDQVWTFSKMDEYPEFCLGELAASEDRALERSSECAFVWCAFVCERQKACRRGWVITGSSIVFSLVE